MLMDKQLSEIHGTYSDLISLPVDRGQVLEKPSSDYKRYEFTPS
jgi:hypothetical protein